ncbi:MAG: YdcF family protein [Ignavibacteriaceae bacterium]
MFSKSFVTSFSIFFNVADLLFLFFLKYKNQNLPLKDFRIMYIGNLLDLLFSSVLIIALLIYALQKGKNYKPKMLLTYTIITSIILLLAALSTRVDLPLPNIYVLDHPLKKVAVGVIFSLYQFSIFLQIMLIWQIIFGAKELIGLRAFINSFVLTFVLLAIAFFYNHFKIGSGESYAVKKNQTNVAVVLGAAVWSHNSVSPSLAARVDKAVELYKKGIVNKIQLTGGNAPGELSEAEVAYDYMKPQNINHSDIWLETKTASTLEQVKFVKDSLLAKKNISHIIIVSDGYHLTRVREICKFFHIKTFVSASGLDLSTEHKLYYKLRESIALTVFWLFAL